MTNESRCDDEFEETRIQVLLVSHNLLCFYAAVGMVNDHMDCFRYEQVLR